MRRFFTTMQIAPDNLADRLDGLFVADSVSAIAQIEGLVQETIVLINLHMPDVDTSVLQHYLGERQRPWTSEAHIEHRHA
jgi:hypothetical protein